jgi:glycosyltransferase involved in cell wall biosynthesis
MLSLAETEHDVFHLQLEPRIIGGSNFSLPDHVTQIPWREPGRSAPRILYPWLRTELRALIQQIQPDVIHAGPIPSCAFLTASSGFQPLVSMSWGSDLLIDAKGGIWRWMAKYALQGTAICLCDCETVREAALSLGMPADRIVVFPWGVDLELFHPSGPNIDLRGRLGGDDQLVLISTRAWEPLYGIADLIQAFILAAHRNQNLRLILMNDGAERKTILPSLESAGVLDRVHFAGWVPENELPAWFRTADVYLSASYSDGSSISLLQAMACGLPALVSDIPGNLEWIDPRFNGWTFPVGDIEALSDQILSIANDPSLIESFGAKSRATVESRANWKRNFGTLLEIYQLARSMEVS